MFERLTDRGRRVIVLAQEEARLFGHNYIGTEHILLGLLHEGEGVAAQVLQRLKIELETVRAEVEEIIGSMPEKNRSGSGQAGIPFTPRAKKVLDLSLREALQLGHNYIGTEHILLALIREGEGVAAQALVRLGADLSTVRQQTIAVLAGYEVHQRNPVRLVLSPSLADALVNWISHFDRANGPISEDHPLRLLHDELSAGLADAHKAG